MTPALALLGWLAWVAVSGYIVVCGFGMAFLSGAFSGRANPWAVAIGILGAVLLWSAALNAPFHMAWGHS